METGQSNATTISAFEEILKHVEAVVHDGKYSEALALLSTSSDLQICITYFCRKSINGIGTCIRPSLSFLRHIITEETLPSDALPVIVTTTALLSAQEMYFSGAYSVVKLLFSHHYGFETVVILQKLIASELPEDLINDISQTTIVSMARGAVNLYTMAFWGPDPITEMEFPLSPMLPYLFRGIDNHQAVCKEVTQSLAVIVVKHGVELDANSWDAIIQLLEKIAKIEDIQEEEAIMKKFHYVISHIYKFTTHQHFTGSLEKFYNFVDGSAPLQSDDVLLGLVTYKYEREAALNMDFISNMHKFLSKYIGDDSKVHEAVRAKASKISDFLGIIQVLLKMEKNIEVKACVKDFDETYAKIQRLCLGEEPKITHHSVTYFTASDGRLSLREFLDPDKPKAELLLYDRSEVGGPIAAEFVKTEVNDVKNLKEALQVTMTAKGTLKKTRYLFKFGQTQIYLDRIEKLGDFLVLEIALHEDQEAIDGYNIGEDIMGQLGIYKESLIQGAYIDQLLENMDD